MKKNVKVVDVNKLNVNYANRDVRRILLNEKPYIYLKPQVRQSKIKQGNRIKKAFEAFKLILTTNIP